MKPVDTVRNNWPFLVATIAIVVLTFLLSSYSVTEGDLFWHLKSGEWIAHHKAIPDKDPFAYSTNLFFEPQNITRQHTILSSYWLGQVMLYGVWMLGGYTGIILMRATIYAVLIGSLAGWIGKTSRGVLAVTGILAASATILPISNERPQIFCLLFFLVVLALLEAARKEKEHFHPALWVMPCILALWSNIHGSYLLADAVLVLFGAIHIVPCIIKRSRPSWSYLGLIVVSLAASALNPSSLDILPEFIRHYNTGVSAVVSEYVSPITMALKYKIFTPYWVLVIIVVGTLLTKWKQMEWEHRIVLLFLLAISLKNLRYVQFFLCVIPFAYLYLPARLNSRWKIAIVIALVTVWAGTRTYRYTFVFMPHALFPADAVKFINETQPSGPLFNHIDWGGYVMFFSGRQVFCDGRYMVNSARKIHDQILLSASSSSELLDRYGINILLIPGTNTFVNSMDYGKPWPLLSQLQRDDHWALVHFDNTALVFLRKNRGNDQIIASREIPKARIAEHLYLRSQWQRRK